MEEERDFFADHYNIFLIGVYILLMAMVIFFLAIPLKFQICLFVASALILVWMLHGRQPDDPPCGGDVGGEAIARPRPGFHPK